MDEKDYEWIQGRIGYRFINHDLLQQAFVRKSYAQENGGEDNEVLEFIGDKVLDIVVVKLLTDMYGYFCSDCDDQYEYDEFCCQKNEGQLTVLKKRLVEKKTLASVIERNELNRFLIMGKGDIKNNIQNESSVKEDLFEAIIGAVTLDCKWEWDEITGVIEYMLRPEEHLEKNDEENYVDLIQDWSLRKCGELPDIYTDHSSCYDEHWLLYDANVIVSKADQDDSYSGSRPVHVINVQEYPKTHFYCRLRLNGIPKKFIGLGSSKNEARRLACKAAYNYLEQNDLLFTIKDEIEAPNINDAISQLEILARRGYFSIPTYEFIERHDKNGNPVWKARCFIDEYAAYFEAVSSSKKEAKKQAAYDMLLFVLNEEDD